MSEIDNVMRAERARTGNYGADCDYDEELREPCPMCGSVRYEKVFKYNDGGICGCDDCVTERWAV